MAIQVRDIQLTTGLPDRAIKACNATGFIIFAVSFIALEYWRWHAVGGLLKSGFVNVPNTTLYARAIAGQSLSYADFPAPIVLAILAVLCGFAGNSALVLIAKLELGTAHLKTPALLTLFWLIIGAILVWAVKAAPPPQTLTLNLPAGIVSRNNGPVVPLGAITGFSNYEQSGNKSTHQELGGVLSTGETTDLMELPDDSPSEGTWAAQTMANFLTSHGQTLPTY
jgi:hypothetical protein